MRCSPPVAAIVLSSYQLSKSASCVPPCLYDIQSVLMDAASTFLILEGR